MINSLRTPFNVGYFLSPLVLCISSRGASGARRSDSFGYRDRYASDMLLRLWIFSTSFPSIRLLCATPSPGSSRKFCNLLFHGLCLYRSYACKGWVDLRCRTDSSIWATPFASLYHFWIEALCRMSVPDQGTFVWHCLAPLACQSFLKP